MPIGPPTVSDVVARPDEPWIWTSGPVSTDAGPGVVVVVVNPSSRPFHYGVSGTVERAEPDGWVRVGGFASSLDGWGGLGRIVSDGRIAVRLIGLGAAAHGTGEAEYLSIGGLAAGRYRLGHQESRAHDESQHRRIATGTFVVSDTRQDPITITVAPSRGGGLSDPVGGRLTVRPPLLLAETAATVIVHVGVDGSSTAGFQAAFEREMGNEIGLRAWTGRTWSVPLMSVPVHVRSVPGFDTTERFVDPPGLGQGSYQVSCPHPGGDLTAIIWVSDDIPVP